MGKTESPRPVVVTTICSLCGLAWESHGDKPTTEDCIRLLKAELAKRFPVTIYQQSWNTPWWYYWHQNNTGAVTYTVSNTVDLRRPDDGGAVPSAA